MEKKCVKCGLLVSDGRLVLCPDCKGGLIEFGNTEPIQLTENQMTELISKAKKGAAKELWGWFWKGFAAIAVLSFIYSGFTLDKLYRKAIDIVQGQINERISEEFETPRIRNTISDIASLQSKDLMAKKISPIVNDFKDETNKQLSEINKITDFSMLLFAAQNGDRNAFDSMINLSRADNKFSKFSIMAAQDITDTMYSTISLDIKFNWEGRNINPDDLSIDEFSTIYNDVHYRLRPFLLSELWKSNKFTKKEKLEFLYSVIKTDSSLKALKKACQLMDKEAELNKNILAYKLYLKWWEDNKSSYESEE
jgi:hypothetical protein